MQWSKMRSNLRALVTPDLRKRVDFHLTVYRKLSECAHEFWISIDGQKIFTASYSKNNIATYVVTRTTGLMSHGDGPEPKIVTDMLIEHEIHAPEDIASSIRSYFDLNPRIALSSTDPILKALAMLDRRIGKRTLQSIELGEEEHSLVRAFHRLRMQSIVE